MPDDFPASACTSFIVTGDPQITGAGDLELLAHDVKVLSTRLQKAAFLVVLGDLTKSGTDQQLEGYRATMAALWDKTYHVFGGHDGLAEQSAGRLSIDRFERVVGPAWQSWNAGDVHFVCLTTECEFLTPQQYDRQLRWLADDLAATAETRSLVCFCHIPPDDAQYQLLRRQRHRLSCIFLGHWHTPHCDRIDETWILSPGAQRGRDVGAAARTAIEARVSADRVETRLISLDLIARAPASAPKWTLRLGGVGQMIGAPVAEAGSSRAYCPIAQFDATVEDEGGLACVDSRSGKVLWHSRWLGGVLGTPAVLREHVAALTVNGRVFCLRKSDGSLCWQHALYPDPRLHEGGFINCRSQISACERGLLVLGSNRPLTLLDARSGRPIREFAPPAAGPPVITAAPVPIEDDHFILASPGQVRRIDIVSGQVVWETPTAKKRTRYCSPAAIAGGRAFFSAQDFHAIDLTTGAIAWTRPLSLGAGVLSPPIIHARASAVIAMGRIVTAFRQSTGEIVWTFDPFADKPAHGIDASAGGAFGCFLDNATDELIFGCDNGNVYALDASTGAIRWTIDVGAPIKRPPARAGDSLIVHDYLGNLFGFNP